MAAAAKFNFPIPNPPDFFSTFYCLLNGFKAFSCRTQNPKKKKIEKNKMEKRSENFSTCVGSFLVERQGKNVEENSFKVVGESEQKKNI